MKQSAGTLLFQRGAPLLVLIVHPSGNYNRRAPWSIPKGEPDEGEELVDAARRETQEETGIVAPEILTPLGSLRYRKSRKQIHCFAGEVTGDKEPCCNSWEVDQACFVPLEKARELLHPDQIEFLDRLETQLGAGE